ncbi:hypothetical protein J6590_032092 [Homalodisca vitripennis]|nr:hypothetical protein J6590_032092 [Homalodisca vitripennis]
MSVRILYKYEKAQLTPSILWNGNTHSRTHSERGIERTSHLRQQPHVISLSPYRFGKSSLGLDTGYCTGPRTMGQTVLPFSRLGVPKIHTLTHRIAAHCTVVCSVSSVISVQTSIPLL